MGDGTENQPPLNQQHQPGDNEVASCLHMFPSDVICGNCAHYDIGGAQKKSVTTRTMSVPGGVLLKAAKRRQTLAQGARSCERITDERIPLLVRRGGRDIKKMTRSLN